MQTSGVARRYAEALFALASESGRLEALDHGAKVLRESFGDRSVRTFFAAPQIPRERKKQLLDQKLAGKSDPLLINLLKVLIDKGRFTHLPAILDEFDTLTDQSRGVEEAEIVSAVALSEQQLDAVKQQLLRFSAYGDLRVTSRVDPSILGGVLVRLGKSQVLDGTAATRLRELRDRMYRHRGRGLGA